MTSQKVKCAHPGCTCQVESGTQYCSRACEEAGSSSSMSECGCGHSGCGVTEPVSATGHMGPTRK
jgi:hypothetical protein